MATYNTRAISRPAGYYRSLNSRSTADAYCHVSEPANRSCGYTGDFYEVERIVSSRVRKGGAEYLVLWAGYRREDASWVTEGDITSAALQYFNYPQPSFRHIADSVSTLTEAIQRSLRMGVNRGCHFTVDFQTDTFKFLFDSKGTDCEHGTGRLYTIDDFDTTYFTADWYRTYDKLGDGCEVEFPLRMRSRVKWSPVMYDSSRAPLPKYYKVCTVWMSKKRC